MSGLRTHVFASRKKGRMKKVNYDKYGWYFILPFIIVFLVFSLYPILYSLQISFTDLKNFSKGFSYVGFGNYIDTLKLPFFWTAMRNTFLFCWHIGLQLFHLKCGVSLFLNSVSISRVL